MFKNLVVYRWGETTRPHWIFLITNYLSIFGSTLQSIDTTTHFQAQTKTCLGMWLLDLARASTPFKRHDPIVRARTLLTYKVPHHWVSQCMGAIYVCYTSTWTITFLVISNTVLGGGGLCIAGSTTWPLKHYPAKGVTRACNIAKFSISNIAYVEDL